MRPASTRVRLLLDLALVIGAGIAAGGCALADANVHDGDRSDFVATETPELASEGESGGTASPATDGLALSVHTTLGLPEAASVGDARHYLLVKPQYVTSFDSQRKNPRWTSWELTTSWMGSTPRSPSFKRDTMLPNAFPQPTNADFTNSGFQRGHLCPSADRNKNETDNESTFVFTNVVPQTAESNTGTWESLERVERSLAQGSGHVFIIAGSIYADDRTIGDGVAVPTSMFKVVVAMSGARPKPSDVTTSTRVITVEIPNTTTVSGDFKRYRTSFASIEAKTGFRFLSDVAPAIHDSLANRVDTQSVDELDVN